MMTSHNPLLIITHLIAFFLPFLLLLNASPAPDPYPAVVSLPARAPPASRSVHQAQPTPQVEHDLLPFVLISTIDGALHAVDREKGKLRWTLKEGVSPLVGGGTKGKMGDEEYIVEPLSGSLFVFEEEQGAEGAPKVRKLPLSVEQLIEMSPFTFPHSPSRTFTGSKHTSLLTVDLRTGNPISCFSSLHNASVLDDDCMCDDGEMLDDLEGKSRTNRDVLFVGRTDYRLTIHSPPTMVTSDALATHVSGDSGSRRSLGVQEIAYSSYTPNSYDKPLAEYWSKVGSTQTLWEADGTVARRMRVELGHDGKSFGVEQGGKVKWSTDLGSAGIAVYDILQPLIPTNANPILVPQPPPHLPSLFPPKSHDPQYDIANHPPKTYIASLPLALALPPAPVSDIDDNGSISRPYERQQIRRPSKKPILYALSSSSYPLINFAPLARQGNSANASFLLSEDVPEQDQLLPYLLDPPAEDMALVPIGETGVVESHIRPRDGTQARRNWMWWIMGAIGALVLCVSVLTSLLRRGVTKQTGTPPVDEKTPLLLAPGGVMSTSEKGARSVTIVEPELPSQTPKADALAGDDEATPVKKKSNRRRVRGRKKRRDSNATAVDKDGEGDEDDEEDKGESSSSPPNTVRKRDDKPLPELPREISTTALADEEDKERLAISDCIIGFGSHGTVVLKGTWGGRPVAVKRLLSDFTRLASQEVKLLQASDDHPNVIRYYCQERRDNFLYIALDLCQASLADLIESPDKHMELASALDRKKALSQVTAGLKHLHGMKIIHRDIKPQNVLVSQAKDRSLRMLVSDFGLARRLEQDQSSFAPTANNLAGSLGWRAPECIRGQVRLNEVFDRASSHSSSSFGSSSSLLDLAVEAEEKEKGKGYARLTKAVDLFALGCLYFWVLMSGDHPFGAVYDRESNIVKGEAVNMPQLDILGEEGWEAKQLIGSLLSMDPGQRPDTAECLIHPFFWTPSKRLSFLCDASDRFEIMEADPPETSLVQLETSAVDVVGKDWYSRLDKTVTSNLGKYRKYKGNSVRDLLRAMRNKKHHYQDLEPAVKRHLGALPSGFLHYFTSRYPMLFLHVHGVIKDSRLRHESMFEAYFQEA